MRANTFRPLSNAGVTTHTQITSTGTADVHTLTLDAKTEAVLITVKTTSCWLTIDGETPTALVGLELPVGVLHFIPIGKAITLSFASTAGANSVINVAQLS